MPVGFTKALGAVLLLMGAFAIASGAHGDVFSLGAVYLLAGIGALIAALTSRRLARQLSLLCGVVFALICLSGFFAVEPVVRWLNLTWPENYLHLAIAAACLFVGLASLDVPGRDARRPAHRSRGMSERAALARRPWKVGVHG